MYSNKNIDRVVREAFPWVDSEKIELIERLPEIYKFWNERINLISRKDIDNIFERHILHSLSIAKLIRFEKGTKVLDVGTGGGFPGVPLAILFPETEFMLIDSIGKKIKVVEEVSNEIGLSNISAKQIRAERLRESFDFVVSRAVTNLPRFMSWIEKRVSPRSFNSLGNGVLYLKGGDFVDEIDYIRNEKGKEVELFDIYSYFPSEFFETKKIVYIRF